MKFGNWLWFIAVIVALFSPTIVDIFHHIQRIHARANWIAGRGADEPVAVRKLLRRVAGQITFHETNIGVEKPVLFRNRQKGRECASSRHLSPQYSAAALLKRRGAERMGCRQPATPRRQQKHGAGANFKWTTRSASSPPVRSSPAWLDTDGCSLATQE